MINYRGHHNGLKTAMLLAGMGGFIMFCSWLIFGQRPEGLILGLIVALGMNAWTYWNSASLALRSMHAQPVTEEQQPVLYAITRELAVKANKPMPRLFVSPTAAPNAFATGRNPKNAAVCCTQGILDLLDERELRGVIAHELMHVYNRDILTSCIAASLAQTVTYLGFARYFTGRSRNYLAATVVAMVGPLAAGIIQMALSRTREFEADAGAALLSEDPLGLANALHKIEVGTQQAPLPPKERLATTSSMMIANPFLNRDRVGHLFATHPPMSERIRRLEQMAGAQDV